MGFKDKKKLSVLLLLLIIAVMSFLVLVVPFGSGGCLDKDIVPIEMNGRLEKSGQGATVGSLEDRDAEICWKQLGERDGVYFVTPSSNDNTPIKIYLDRDGNQVAISGALSPTEFGVNAGKFKFVFFNDKNGNGIYDPDDGEDIGVDPDDPGVPPLNPGWPPTQPPGGDAGNGGAGTGSDPGGVSTGGDPTWTDIWASPVAASGGGSCGDNVVQPWEQCDISTNKLTEQCLYSASGGPDGIKITGLCNMKLRDSSGAVTGYTGYQGEDECTCGPPPLFCGNGVLDNYGNVPGEECDPGYGSMFGTDPQKFGGVLCVNPNAKCNPISCLCEAPLLCGDGTVQAPEQCDPGNPGFPGPPATPVAVAPHGPALPVCAGFPAGSTCSSAFDNAGNWLATGCVCLPPPPVDPICGDGIVTTLGADGKQGGGDDEACDPAATPTGCPVGNKCGNVGDVWGGMDYACRCIPNTNVILRRFGNACGDGVIDVKGKDGKIGTADDEGCEPGPPAQFTSACTTAGATKCGAVGSNNQCKCLFEDAPPPGTPNTGYCGDNIIQAPNANGFNEECDDNICSNGLHCINPGGNDPRGAPCTCPATDIIGSGDDDDVVKQKFDDAVRIVETALNDRDPCFDLHVEVKETATNVVLVSSSTTPTKEVCGDDPGEKAEMKATISEFAASHGCKAPTGLELPIIKCGDKRENVASCDTVEGTYFQHLTCSDAGGIVSPELAALLGFDPNEPITQSMLDHAKATGPIAKASDTLGGDYV